MNPGGAFMSASGPAGRSMPTTASFTGIEALHLPVDLVPRLDEVNQRLRPLTGFQAKPVSGYVPPYLFFDCLRRREFPTTITIRRPDRLDYLPELDIFHDLAGHVPMHTGPPSPIPSCALVIVLIPPPEWRGKSATLTNARNGFRASSGLWRASSGSPSSSD
jgi:Biopterin-dependent aromatic amino acid hydroxylase